VDTNFFGPLRVTDALVPSMHSGSRIVMVSSAMGQLSCLSGELRKQVESPTLTREQLINLMQDFVRSVGDNTAARKGWSSSSYSVSKAGLNMLTRVLSKELAPRGIVVNAVHPGWVRTDMGGPSAPLDTTTGARSIVWAAVVSGQDTTGGFFHDGKTIPW
jgi:NAD(P)-dependent dehydrogenase (short-subunit alcohol dehydrogenase family)